MKKISLFFAAMLVVLSTSAKSIFVSHNGETSNSGLTQAQPKPFTNQTVEELLDNGDTIVVMPGKIIFSEPIALAAKSATITGFNFADFADIEAASNAVLDGGDAQRIFDISDGSDVVIKQLVFQNGYCDDDKGGAAIHVDSSEVQIGYCVFENNHSYSSGGENHGGAVFVQKTNLLLYACSFRNNAAFRGGAVAGMSESNITAEYCEFTGNGTNSENANARGGAIVFFGDELMMNYCHFENNYSLRGGGVFFFAASEDSRIVIQNSSIINNHSGDTWLKYYDMGYDYGYNPADGDNHGGVFTIFDGANTTLINTTIAGNTAGGDATGGILYGGGKQFTMINVTATNNRTFGNINHGGGFNFTNDTEINIYNSIIERNYTMADRWWSDINIGYYSSYASLTVRNSVLGASQIFTETVDADYSLAAYSYYPLPYDEGYYDVYIPGYGYDYVYGDPGKNVSGISLSMTNGCYPLQTTAIARILGDPAYLFGAPWNIDTDQKGNKRGTGATIFAGAVEILESETAKTAYVAAPEDDFWDAYNNIHMYKISLSATPGNGGDLSGDGIFEKGTNHTVTATANPGYMFVFWMEGITPVSYTASYTFTVTGDRTLTAMFTPQAGFIEISVSATSGGTASGSGAFEEGASHTVTATANAGYRFVYWQEEGLLVSTDEDYTFTVAGNRTLVAVFQEITYFEISLSATPTIGGALSGDGIFEEGTSHTVTATANPGYVFVCWIEGVMPVSSNTSYTFTVTGDRTLSAIFTPVQAGLIEISVSATSGGTAIGSGAFEEGVSHTVTATANEGYTFAYWLEDEMPVSTDENYTFTVAGNRTLVAVFQATATEIDTVPDNPAMPVAYYSILGQKLPKEPGSGLYIIVYDDGKVEKVLK